MFKQGQKVNYNTGVNSGTGKIVALLDTPKGAFYEVHDKAADKTYKLRAAKLSKA